MNQAKKRINKFKLDQALKVDTANIIYILYRLVVQMFIHN